MTNEEYVLGVAAARAIDDAWTEATTLEIAAIGAKLHGPRAEQVRGRIAMHRQGRSSWQGLRDFVVVLAWENEDTRPRSVEGVRAALIARL